jgi:PAS domain S-box-containing protein
MARSGQSRDTGDGSSADSAASLFDSLGVGIWVVDPAGRTLIANARAAQLAGRAPGEMVGLPVAGMLDLPPRGRGDAEQREACDRRLHRPDGTWTWVEVLAQPAADGATPPGSSILTLVDVTERRAREAALHARADGGEVLAQFAELLLLGADPDDFLQRAVSLLAEELALPLLAVGHASRDETEVTSIATAGRYAEEDPDRWNGRLRVPKNGATMTALRTGRTIVVDNYREPGTYASGPVIAGTQAIGSATIPVNRTTWLAAFSEEPGAFDSHCIELLESVSRLISARWPEPAEPLLSGAS